jgi:lipopolysaccharide biosynthesis glycosyltransferase
MQTKPSFTVATGIDDNYVLPFLVMIYSAKVNSVERFQVRIGFDSDALSARSREILTQVLRQIEVPFDFAKLTLSEDMRPKGHISATSYSRLLLADQNSGLMLWLDSDLICLPGWDAIFTDVKNLPNGKVMSVVRDQFVSTKGIEYLKKSSNESVRIMGPDYFNTGVALIDCDVWKALNYPQLWPKLLMEADARGFQFADQCVINFLSQRHVNYLPFKYNTLAGAKMHNRKNTPCILHFASRLKPWSYMFFDSRILKGDLFFSDIYKYLRYQSKLIKTIKLENRALGSILIDEKRRIRAPFRFSRMDLNRDFLGIRFQLKKR